jgi:DNA-3-methyladenine glycosylase
MKKLPIAFYQRKDVVKIAEDLIGKILVSKFDGRLTSGMIVETEAYIGLTDKASHSFGGRRTAKNEYMYAAPGTAYVYVCYGMHQLFNVVTNKKDIPDAVLIRAIEPLQGMDIMLQRTGKLKSNNTLTRGPGNVGKALGINKAHSGLNLLGNELFICEGIVIKEKDSGRSKRPDPVGSSKRIGVENSGLAALYPYRFYLKGNKYVSGYPNK